MKNLIITILVFTVFSSCDKKLDLAPENTLIARDVFKSEAGTEQALAEGYYNLMRAVTGNIAYTYGDFTTPNLEHSVYYATFDNAETDPKDEAVLAVWTNYYNSINTANSIIENVREFATYSEQKQDQFISEARFIRALAYLDLLKFFGDGALTGEFAKPGVPLQLTPFKGYNTGEYIGRSNNGAVYEQIIKDITESIPHLPEQHSNDLGTRSRATKGTGYALLSRVYLYMRQYENAYDAASKVLDKSPAIYELTQNLLMLFPENSAGTAKTLTKEYILAFPVSQMVSSSTSANNNLGNGYFFKRSFWIPSSFINSFEPGDLRVSQLMFKGDQVFNTDRLNEFTTFKFNNSNGRDNVPVIRLAEIMLTAAESYARTNGVSDISVSLLNDVRSRSIPSATPYATSDFSSPGELINTILDERCRELAYEGHYRYDLIRTDRPLKNPDIRQDRKVLPIPQIEVDITNGVITQNIGYTTP
jgi:tetratricopeptide (TPR) repeat protein